MSMLRVMNFRSCCTFRVIFWPIFSVFSVCALERREGALERTGDWADSYVRLFGCLFYPYISVLCVLDEGLRPHLSKIVERVFGL